MAAKRRGSVAPYVALLVALVILVPPVREVVLDLLAPLFDLVEDLNPARSQG